MIFTNDDSTGTIQGASASANADPNSSVIEVTDTSTTRTITIPPAAQEYPGRPLIVMDTYGAAGTNNVTVKTTGLTPDTDSQTWRLSRRTTGDATVRLITATALPACTAAGSGVGKTLTGNAVGALSIDSVAVANADIVLVKNQANAADNGIYTVTEKGVAVTTAFILTRKTTFDQAAEVLPGYRAKATAGTVNANLVYALVGGIDDQTSVAVTTNYGSVTLFSDGIDWHQGQSVSAAAPGTDSTAIHTNVSSEISGLTEKTTLVGNDILVIEDSAASNAKKKVIVTNLHDLTAIHVGTSGEISGIAAKTTPVAADLLVIEDSASSNAKKSLTLSNLKKVTSATGDWRDKYIRRSAAFCGSNDHNADYFHTQYFDGNWNAPSAGSATGDTNTETGFLSARTTGATANSYQDFLLLAAAAIFAARSSNERWYLACELKIVANPTAANGLFLFGASGENTTSPLSADHRFGVGQVGTYHDATAGSDTKFVCYFNDGTSTGGSLLSTVSLETTSYHTLEASFDGTTISFSVDDETPVTTTTLTQLPTTQMYAMVSYANGSASQAHKFKIRNALWGWRVL